MIDKLRRFDVQARVAVVLAVLAAIPAAAAVYLEVSRYDRLLGQIIYGSQGRFVPALLGCIAISASLAGVAFLLGLSSAGQRRNDHQRSSWIGFFLGGSVLTINVILFAAFWMLRLEAG